MNKSFQAVAAAFRSPPDKITHAQHVARIYRKSLKLCLSWAIDRDIFNSEALKIRAEFDANSNLSADSGKTKSLVRAAEKKLEYYTHPEPYVVCWMPGGSKFMRNPPLPLEAVFDGKIPEDAEVSPVPAVNIDMTPLPRKKTVLVDFSSKEYL